MYRSFILVPKRLTFGQRWKFNRIKDSVKNKNNNPYIMITQCDTIEKINKIQKLIDKQKKLISPALLAQQYPMKKRKNTRKTP